MDNSTHPQWKSSPLAKSTSACHNTPPFSWSKLATRQTEQKQLIRLRGWNEAGQQLEKIASMKTIVSIEKLQEYRKSRKRPNSIRRHPQTSHLFLSPNPTKSSSTGSIPSSLTIKNK